MPSDHASAVAERTGLKMMKVRMERARATRRSTMGKDYFSSPPLAT
jgi:hypothetical protein